MLLKVGPHWHFYPYLFHKTRVFGKHWPCGRDKDKSASVDEVLTSKIIIFKLKAVIKFMEERVQSLIVTAVLEHEAISGLSSHKQPVGQSGRARYLFHRATSSVFLTP